MTDFSIGSDQWIEFIIQNAGAMGIAVDVETAEKLAFHAAEAILWNTKINLTAITDPMDVAVKHVLDSMTAAPLISDDTRVLDIGSGGGFPGLVLKIVKPSLSVVMVDASRKKVSFLKHVIRMLCLAEIEAIHARTEDLMDMVEFAQKFDMVVCRAFSSLDAFFSMARHFVKDSGTMIAYKGKDAQKELQDFFPKQEKQGSFAAELRSYILPADIKRSLIILRKKQHL